MTTVIGITSTLDITWFRSVINGTVIKTVNRVNASSTTSTSLIYTDIYMISLFNLDEHYIRFYHCEAVINASPQIRSVGSIKLDLISELT